jgi:sugar-specific transcriptional regulator TrmB
MNPDILESIGLTHGESRVYLTLLRIGRSSAGDIITQSGVTRSKIYDVLERLKQKGLVSVVTEGKIRVFAAVPPKRLHEFLEAQRESLTQRETALQQILPQLNAVSKEKAEPSAEILYGPRGIKAFFDMSLYDNTEECYVLGYSKEASAYFNAYFRNFHKERIRRGIHGKVIYDYDTWFLKERGKRKFVEQRYLPKGAKTPAFIYIFGDTVGTIVFTEKQKLCFMIRNAAVAESYKQYFMMLWKQAIRTGK